MSIHFANTELSDCIAETWRVTSGFTGDVHPIVNWEISDQVGTGSNGYTVCNESNGIFTCNQTGWYYIDWWMYISGNCDSEWNEMTFDYSWNNGSNYQLYHYTQAHLHSGATRYTAPHANTVFSVSSISGDSCRKFRFKINQDANSDVSTAGHTETSHTGFTIIKIADI